VFDAIYQEEDRKKFRPQRKVGLHLVKGGNA
jgi:hypothetical protein